MAQSYFDRAANHFETTNDLIIELSKEPESPEQRSEQILSLRKNNPRFYRQVGKRYVSTLVSIDYYTRDFESTLDEYESDSTIAPEAIREWVKSWDNPGSDVDEPDLDKATELLKSMQLSRRSRDRLSEDQVAYEALYQIMNRVVWPVYLGDELRQEQAKSLSKRRDNDSEPFWELGDKLKPAFRKGMLSEWIVASAIEFKDRFISYEDLTKILRAEKLGQMDILYLRQLTYTLVSQSAKYGRTLLRKRLEEEGLTLITTPFRAASERSGVICVDIGEEVDIDAIDLSMRPTNIELRELAIKLREEEISRWGPSTTVNEQADNPELNVTVGAIAIEEYEQVQVEENGNYVEAEIPAPARQANNGIFFPPVKEQVPGILFADLDEEDPPASPETLSPIDIPEVQRTRPLEYEQHKFMINEAKAAIQLLCLKNVIDQESEISQVMAVKNRELLKELFTYNLISEEELKSGQLSVISTIVALLSRDKKTGAILKSEKTREGGLIVIRTEVTDFFDRMRKSRQGN
jgi:hypothetical protein